MANYAGVGSTHQLKMRDEYEIQGDGDDGVDNIGDKIYSPVVRCGNDLGISAGAKINQLTDTEEEDDHFNAFVILAQESGQVMYVQQNKAKHGKSYNEQIGYALGIDITDTAQIFILPAIPPIPECCWK